MYLKRADAHEILASLREELSGDLKAKWDFLLAMGDQDDWSFVIKSHALVETAVGQLLIDHLGDHRIQVFINHLPLSDSDAGKLVLAKHLDLIEDRHRRFIRWFSSLRNRLVHNFDQMNFSFKDHVAALDQQARRNWVDSVTSCDRPESPSQDLRRLAIESPRTAILLALISVIGLCVVDRHRKRGLDRIDRSALATTSEYLTLVESATRAREAASKAEAKLRRTVKAPRARRHTSLNGTEPPQKSRPTRACSR